MTIHQTCCHDDCHCTTNRLHVVHGELSEAEQAFLLRLEQHQYLPVVQFVAKSTRESSFECIALSPVYLYEKTDDMQTVKATGELLTSLEKKGLVTLDYDITLSNYDYSMYEQSSLYNYFKETIEEGKKRDGFLADQAVIVFGSIAPAENG